ncbi:MAG TPA: cupin [Dehalococcoidia bacterium]|nr:cupin [Dehalococcoidia bacterium]
MARAGHTYKRTHRITGKVLAFDLRAEEAALIAKARASSSGRAAKTLVKQGALRSTISSLRRGTQLSEHAAAGAVSVQVLRGRVRFESDGTQQVAGPGGVVMFDEDVPHSATALADSSILITTAMP